MTDANPLRSMRCPNCGAPLDYQPGQTSIRCRFCDSVIEHSGDALTPDDHAHVLQTNIPSVQITSSEAGPARRFVIKLRDGQPVVIESGGRAGMNVPTMDQMYQASRTMNAPGSVTMLQPARPARRSSSCGGCVLAIVIVLATFGLIGGIALATAPQTGTLIQQLLSGQIQKALGTVGSLGTNILLTRSGTIVPGPNDGPAEAIMLTIQYPPSSSSTKENRIVAVSTTTRAILWQTAPLDPNLSDAPILANSSFIFTVSGQQLLAINRTDGTIAWQAALADKVELNICKDCVQLVGTHLAALSADGTLAVFDAATGKSQWKITAKQDSPRGLYLLGQRLAFLDAGTESHGILRTFDPATGKETQIQPECQTSDSSNPDYTYWDTALFVTPDGSDFYTIFGTSTVCAQRWDAKSLKQIWSTALPDDFSSGIDSATPVLSADTLYLAASHTVDALTISSGDLSTVENDADYNFNVLAVHAGDVILQATRQRGTSRDEIWAVNSAAGTTDWTFDLGDTKPLDFGGIVDDNTPEWFVHPTTAGLLVVDVKSAADNKSHALLLATLDWQTGQTSAQKTVPLGISTIILDSPDWIIWKNDTLWMVIEEELLSIDTAQNKITYRWP